MLLKLCEPKSQVFLVTKREQSGCMAWHKVNKWYMETSGLGATERMTALMNPKQAKGDEDVLTVLEKWEDEMTELRALGASQLPYDYKLTALRMIATPAIKEKMDMVDAKVDPTDKRARYRNQYEAMSKWAHIKLRESGNKSMTAMDLNRIGAYWISAMHGAADHGWPPQPQADGGKSNNSNGWGTSSNQFDEKLNQLQMMLGYMSGREKGEG